MSLLCLLLSNFFTLRMRYPAQRNICNATEKWLGKGFFKVFWAEWEFCCLESFHLHLWEPQDLETSGNSSWLCIRIISVPLTALPLFLNTQLLYSACKRSQQIGAQSPGIFKFQLSFSRLNICVKDQYFLFLKKPNINLFPTSLHVTKLWSWCAQCLISALWHLQLTIAA